MRAATPYAFRFGRHPFIRFIGASRQKTDLTTGLHAGTPNHRALTACQ